MVDVSETAVCSDWQRLDMGGNVKKLPIYACMLVITEGGKRERVIT